MKKLNVDWSSKTLWTSLVALTMLLIQQVLKVFGVEFSNDLQSQILGITNTILLILVSIGVVKDTTKGNSNNEK